MFHDFLLRTLGAPQFRVDLGLALVTTFHIGMEFVDFARLSAYDLNQFDLFDVEVLLRCEEHPLVHKNHATAILVVFVEPLLCVLGVFDLGSPLTEFAQLRNKVVDFESVVVVLVHQLEHEVVAEVEDAVLEEGLEFRTLDIVVLLSVLAGHGGLGLVEC